MRSVSAMCGGFHICASKLFILNIVLLKNDYLQQKGWRRFSYTILHHTYSRGNSHVFHGVSSRADAYDWRSWGVQNRTYFQRYLNLVFFVLEFGFYIIDWQVSVMRLPSCHAGWTCTTSSFLLGPFSTSSCPCEPNCHGVRARTHGTPSPASTHIFAKKSALTNESRVNTWRMELLWSQECAL